MVSKKSRSEVRRKKHMKLRNRFSGTAQRPRLAVFRSNNHMYAQIIDDTVGNTLVSASTLQKEVKAELEKTNDVEAAAYLGKVIAERAKAKGIDISKADSSATRGSAVPKTARYSTLQDLDAKMHTEIDMFSGAIMKMGKELNIPTPYNEFVYHIIKAMEEKNDGLFDYK